MILLSLQQGVCHWHDFAVIAARCLTLTWTCCHWSNAFDVDIILLSLQQGVCHWHDSAVVIAARCLTLTWTCCHWSNVFDVDIILLSLQQGVCHWHDSAVIAARCLTLTWVRCRSEPRRCTISSSSALSWPWLPSRSRISAGCRYLFPAPLLSHSSHRLHTA